MWGPGEYTERREGVARVNNGTHSHSASTYMFLVASLLRTLVPQKCHRNNLSLGCKEDGTLYQTNFLVAVSCQHRKDNLPT